MAPIHHSAFVSHDQVLALGACVDPPVFIGFPPSEAIYPPAYSPLFAPQALPRLKPGWALRCGRG